MSEIELSYVSTFEGRAKFGRAYKQQTRRNHTHFHSCLIVEKTLIQYPIIYELPIIQNEQFIPKIIYNETGTHSKNLKRKS